MPIQKLVSEITEIIIFRKKLLKFLQGLQETQEIFALSSQYSFNNTK